VACAGTRQLGLPVGAAVNPRLQNPSCDLLEDSAHELRQPQALVSRSGRSYWLSSRFVEEGVTGAATGASRSL